MAALISDGAGYDLPRSFLATSAWDSLDKIRRIPAPYLALHGTADEYVHPKYARELTAAHKTLPIPTWVEVTNLENGESVVVRINDRGPFVDDRIIDLSQRAAEELDMIRNGTARVQVRALDAAIPDRTRLASTRAPAPAPRPRSPACARRSRAPPP